MKLHFQHLRDTKNVGDRSCSPFDYFDWGDATVSDLRAADTPAHDVGIYGGGQIFRGLSHYKGVTRNKRVLNIAWGIGSNKSFLISPRHFISKRRMDLIGSRDFGDDRYEYAPCPSCMSPLFDNPPPPSHKVVFYAHAGKTKQMKLNIPQEMPTENNVCGDLNTALSFIASGETVVSNSYHGVYWALLMGRKAICIPFSNKFGHYLQPPLMSSPTDWHGDIGRGISRPEMLALSREATLAFKAKVDARIADHVRQV
ncbi:hypothetical protein SAMN04488005_0589 [Yoonia tamlensis]|uniref:Polysaccharide pyruvyl transferase n=1 Tax=Yoonia tamlensis TaxID=390270 RepID=A0A1I6FVS2_9RHOB|nr:polysaccharide pyruvyl transferase family protein [Yoonia tamlensis]SFR34033.1 hypothetical protein SAMN04488005_0589 [Yoonia tamlensis]